MPPPLLGKLSLFNMDNENLTDEEFRELRTEFVMLRQGVLDRMAALTAELDDVKSALGLASPGQLSEPVPDATSQCSLEESVGASQFVEQSL